MAAPLYDVDLIDIDLAEALSTWVAINYSGGGGAAPAIGIDLAMQGTNCLDRQVSTHERAIVFDNGSTIAGTVSTGVHIFQWLFVATPGLTDTLAIRGAYLVAGTTIANNVQYHVEGNDTYGAAGRVGRCYPYRYNTTASVTLPYRTVLGTPGATPQVFGAGIKTLAAAKGSNLGVDAVRYGTGAYITSGDSSTPATFTAFSTKNDLINNRWGVLTKVGGSYELQGKFVIGISSGGTSTICYFNDSDINIAIVDTPHTQTGFTEIYVNNASTFCGLTNININALGTINKGRFTVDVTNPTVHITGGTWTSIGEVRLNTGTTVNGTTFRQTGSIWLSGGTMINSTIDKALTFTGGTRAAVITSNLNRLSGNTWNSTGTGHAVQLTSLGTGIMDWKNFIGTGYVAGPATGTTGNEAILISVTTGTLTINVGAGYTTPSIKTSGATVTVLAGQVTTTVTVKNTTGGTIDNARVYMIADAGGPLGTGTVIINGLTSGGTISDIRSLASDQPVSGWVRKGSSAPYYKTTAYSATIDSGIGLELGVIMVNDT